MMNVENTGSRVDVSSKVIDQPKGEGSGTIENDRLLWQLTRHAANVIHPNPSLGKSGVLTVERDETLDFLLEKMILAIPVIVKHTSRYYGIVDMIDLVTFITNNFGNYSFSTFQEFDEVHKSVRKFHNTTVGDIVKGSWSYRANGKTINSNFSLFTAFEMMARGQHRCVVVNESTSSVESIITQSMSMDYIRNNMNLMSSDIRNRQIKQLTLHQAAPLCIKETERPLAAFNMMIQNEISGVGVTNEKGELVNVMSIRDLRGLQMESDSIWRLFGNIRDYKKDIKAKFSQSTPSDVIKVKLDDTIETCVNLMSNNKVHRLFAVDEADRPIKCISIRDLLYNIMFRPQPLEA